MVTGNFKMAFDSIRSAKWRSFLSMLGIIIGVTSVVTIVSIGEGVKNQVSNQINEYGADLITVRPGKPVTQAGDGSVTGINFMSVFAGGSLSEVDVQTVRDTPGIGAVSPMSYVTATPEVSGNSSPSTYVIGATSQLPDVLSQKVEYGGFFSESDANKNVAVIGTRVAEDLFKESVPIGSSFTIRGESFSVRGMFEEFEANTFIPGTDYNNAIFIPIETGKRISGNQLTIQQILAKPVDPSTTDSVIDGVRERILASHAGQDDFTVLKQADTIAVANTMLNILTGFISGVAAISLIVGGIGIMNVMLASVNERMREIGIRKTIGASNGQIMSQFVIESAMISFIGSAIGLILATILNGVLRIVTDLEPVVTLPIMGIAVAVSVGVGVLFGVAPAVKAAKKDPIEAMRQI